MRNVLQFTQSISRVTRVLLVFTFFVICCGAHATIPGVLVSYQPAMASEMKIVVKDSTGQDHTWTTPVPMIEHGPLTAGDWVLVEFNPIAPQRPNRISVLEHPTSKTGSISAIQGDDITIGTYQCHVIPATIWEGSLEQSHLHVGQEITVLIKRDNAITDIRGILPTATAHRK